MDAQPERFFVIGEFEGERYVIIETPWELVADDNGWFKGSYVSRDQASEDAELAGAIEAWERGDDSVFRKKLGHEFALETEAMLREEICAGLEADIEDGTS